MTGSVKALVGLEPGVDRNTVEAVLPTDGSVEFVGVVEGLDPLVEAIKRQSVDVVLLACTHGSDQALSFVEEIARDHPDSALIVLQPLSTNGFMSRAVVAGAEDVVTLPDSPGGPAPADRERVSRAVLIALEKAMARRRRTIGRTQGRMVTVVGPKGGAGKTLVSCSLALSLAKAGQRAVIVDLDLQFGDVGLALGITPSTTMYELATSAGSLDEEKVAAFLAQHPSGVRVLLAPKRPDQAGAISLEFLHDLYAILRQTQDWVVVDTPPGFTPEVIASVDASSDVCMVATLDSLSLKNTRLGLETLERMGLEAGRIKLVLNRADGGIGLTRDDAEAITERSADILVPSDREIARSVNEARPVVLSHPRSPASRSLRSLADAYLQTSGPIASRRRSRRFFWSR
jgi:pilus assembly protein CpaE